MSADDRKSKHALTRSGRSRRSFLEGTALAAAATSAGLVRSLTATAAPAPAASESTPANCPNTVAPMKDVEGKVAFITGGDSGIGLGIARACADAGMKVVITYRTKSHLDDAMKYLASAGERVHAVNLDVTDRAGMEKAAVETVQVFQKVHLLVNNAGVGVIGGLSKATYDDWDWGMSVNATGVFNGIRTFLPRIQAHGEGGHVVATSSLAGLLGHGPAGVYTASKFAVVGMMEALRAELEGTNIGVSVFCPGLVNTNIGDSGRNRPASLPDAGFKPDPQMMAQMRAAMKDMKGPLPGMDALEAGQRVLQGVRANDLYILTTPEYEAEFQARGEAVVASLPDDVNAPPARVTMGRMILGKTVYASERDRRRCQKSRVRKA
jgi:NAD(P)-dependent dehydrogenase (short-subunit alcohol dehydrogenase family)